LELKLDTYRQTSNGQPSTALEVEMYNFKTQGQTTTCKLSVEFKI